MNPLTRTVLLAGWAICGPRAVAQNHVPNADFEAHGDCSWGVDFDMLDEWSIPLGCSPPGYFNACQQGLGTVFLGVPTNIVGFEWARSGEGYLCAKTFTAGWDNARYFFTATLTPELLPGEHCVQFWMSLCDSSSYKSGTFHAYFTGAYPNTVAGWDTVWADTWADSAQVTFNTVDVDGNGWYLMQGSFTSTDTLRYASFGNFLREPELFEDLTFIENFEVLEDYFAGYYIEDVYVGACDVGMPDAHSREVIELSPNPVQQGEAVRIVGSLLRSWRIIGVDGAIIAQGRANPNDDAVVLHTDRLAPGAYQIGVEMRDGRRMARPLVVY